MLDIVKAAKTIGFRAYGASGEYEELMNEKMPCIAHVILPDGLQHFIVIYRINEKEVFIADPGRGRYKLKKDDFLKIWQQKAVILLEPQKDLLNISVSHWLTWIYTYIKQQGAWISQIIFLGILYTALGLITAIFIQLLIDRFIPEKDYGKVIYTSLFLLLLLILRSVTGYLRGYFLVVLNKKVNLNITGDFLFHLFRLPKYFFDTRRIGDITARINDSLQIHQTILLFTNATIIDGMIIIGSLAFMTYFSPIIALLNLCILPIYGFLILLNSRKVKMQQNEVMKNHSLVESTYIDSIHGIDEILSFRVSEAFTKLNKKFFNIFQDKIEKLGQTKNKLSFVAEFSGTLLTVSMLTIGSIWVIQGKILLGQFMACYSLLTNILPSIIAMVSAYISIQGAHIAARRLMDMLLINQEENPGNQPFVMKQKLEIRNGAFAYPKGNLLFKRLNLTVEKGKWTSLLGPSGSGKSTIVQIIERKYHLNNGGLFLDNQPVHIFDLWQYREKIAVIPQNIKIFNGTLAENILLGREGANENNILKKLNKYGLTSFFQIFDHGLFTLLGKDGRKLSGGETQLLGLARALYGEPDILIIDEGFSSIDVEVEDTIERVIRMYSNSHAVLMISHDMDKILKSDFVYILGQNGIVEKGIPENLFANEQSYFTKMYKKQKSHVLALTEQVVD